MAFTDEVAIVGVCWLRGASGTGPLLDAILHLVRLHHSSSQIEASQEHPRPCSSHIMSLCVHFLLRIHGVGYGLEKAPPSVGRSVAPKVHIPLIASSLSFHTNLFWLNLNDS